MAATQAQELVSLKLAVNKQTNKVLFAEAEKDFVDVLLSFLTLPLGTIVRLLEEDQSNIGPVTIGSLNSLYHSVTDLNKCLLNQAFKEMLLQPRNSSQDYCDTLKLNIDNSERQKFFFCDRYNCSHRYLSPSTAQRYCRCGSPMSKVVSLSHFCNGFVNTDTTFLTTDDLTVIPNTLDYISFALFQNLGIKCPSSVKQMTVNVTKEKVLDLLKCSLFSKSTLTDLFLEKKPTLERSRVFSCGVENSGSTNIMLKLVTRKSDGKLLFALGGKDFADLLLSFLTFPLGGVVRSLRGNCSMGSIDGLYKSIAELNGKEYFMSEEAKNRLVDPHLIPLFTLRNRILPSIVFVKGASIYVVTDDLIVAPFSPISTLNLLNRFNTTFDDLKEKVVTIGIKECLSMLKASLTSTSALTDGLGHLLTEVKEEKWELISPMSSVF